MTVLSIGFTILLLAGVTGAEITPGREGEANCPTSNPISTAPFEVDSAASCEERLLALAPLGDDRDGQGKGQGQRDDDEDGIRNPKDNCDAVPNPDQEDADGDRIGDACDSDRDGDGIENSTDNCPSLANPGQRDSDADGLGDKCDPTPLPDPDSDEAGLSEASARALSSPAFGHRLAELPRFRWQPQEGAAYYNLQLFRRMNDERALSRGSLVGAVKVLSAWPTAPAYALPRKWVHDGRIYGLAPGTYEWLVWPGIGPKRNNDFGELVGRSTFVVSSAKALIRSSLIGTRKPDRLRGSPEADQLSGRRGSDVLLGSRGMDSLQGGRGNDLLVGGSGADYLSGGRGRDRHRGGFGADHIVSRDGQKDVVACGRGVDRVIADSTDVVRANCELVWKG